MSEVVQTEVKPKPAPNPASPVTETELVVQKGLCAGWQSLDGGRDERNNKKLGLQRHSLQLPSARSLSRIGRPAQPAPAGRAGTSRNGPPRLEAGDVQAAADKGPARLIVDDGASELGLGQMRRSKFLDELRGAICAAANPELTAAGRSVQDCPYLENSIRYYRARSSRQIEKALRRYAPESAGVSLARDYIPFVTARVRRAAAVWARSGEITGIPEEVGSLLPEMGSSPGFEKLLTQVGDTTQGGVSDEDVGSEKASSRTGTLPFDGQDVTQESADPHKVQAQLGSGSPLENGTRTQMESVFGHSFSRVRVHTDSAAVALSSHSKARAFTVGTDIAFGWGEYQPGTLVGDALIAHELAHVVQQRRQEPAGSTPMGAASDNALEDDADRSAVATMAAIWNSGTERPTNTAQTVSPRLNSGLRLSRCNTACPTNVQLGRLHRITLRDSDFFANGFRTGIGAVAEMLVSDSAGRDWKGKLIREKLNAGTNTCGDLPNCTNAYGRTGGDLSVYSEGSGTIFTVGDAFSDRKLGINVPARRNTFYDSHLFVSPTSELHQRALQSCQQSCQQYFECVGGGRIGTSTFQIDRSFTRGDIGGTNVTNVDVAKTQLSGMPAARP